MSTTAPRLDTLLSSLAPDLSSSERDAAATRLAMLLSFLDPDLSSPEQVAFLGLAAGLHGRHLAGLPGLAHGTRRRRAIATLREQGRLTTPGDRPVAGTPPDSHTLDRMLRGKKLWRALELLVRPDAGLHARGLSAFAKRLGPGRAEALEAALRECDAWTEADAEVARCLRLPRYAYVERRIPEEVREMRELAGRLAPTDLVERTALAIGGYLHGADAAQLRERLTRLHDALAPYGEYVLAHWWEILEALRARGLKGAELGLEWRLYLESLILRRRLGLPSELRPEVDVEPSLLKYLRPVPDCGYGVWVEEERALYERMRREYGATLGPHFLKVVWHMAHRRVSSALTQGAGPEAVAVARADYYDTQVMSAARAIVSEVVTALLAPPDGRRLWGHVSAWAAYLERCALRKAARLLRGQSPRTIDLEKADGSNWAARFLVLVALRSAGDDYDRSEWEGLLEASRSSTRTWRRSRRRPAENVVRYLVRHLREAPVIVDTNSASAFPITPLAQLVRRALGGICVSDAERCEVLDRVRAYLTRRPAIEVAYDDGVLREHSVDDAGRLCGMPSAVDDVLENVESAPPEGPEGSAISPGEVGPAGSPAAPLQSKIREVRLDSGCERTAPERRQVDALSPQRLHHEGFASPLLVSQPAGVVRTAGPFPRQRGCSQDSRTVPPPARGWQDSRTLSPANAGIAGQQGPFPRKRGDSRTAGPFPRKRGDSQDSRTRFPANAGYSQDSRTVGPFPRTRGDTAPWFADDGRAALR